MKDWLEDLYRLKRVAREGWRRIGIESPESVAEHSYGVTLLAWRYAREAGLDQRRVLLMALLHDFHEARLGDIPSPEKKLLGFEAVEAAERKAEQAQWPADSEVLELLEELRTGESEEARLVRAMDGLELLIQARLYAADGYAGAQDFIDVFMDSPEARHPAVAAFLAELGDMKKPPPEGGG